MAISKIVYKESANATPVTWMDATTATAAAADIMAPKTAMLADGVMTTGTGSGGGGGLEFESGTWTPAEDINRGTILFSKTHSTPPSFITMVDTSSASTSVANDLLVVTFVDHYSLLNSNFPFGTTGTRWGTVPITFSAGSGVSNAIMTIQYNYSDAGDSTAAYSRYWATETEFHPYGGNATRWWKAGRTYKWIAVWVPTT